jgi:hypothetical protein
MRLREQFEPELRLIRLFDDDASPRAELFVAARPAARAVIRGNRGPRPEQLFSDNDPDRKLLRSVAKNLLVHASAAQQPSCRASEIRFAR